jgi:Tfp pilus assembly protein PilN
MSRQINLYNPLLLKRKSILSALNLLLSTALVMLIIGLGFIFVSYQMTLSMKESEKQAASLLDWTDKVAKLRSAAAARVKDPQLNKKLAEIEAETKRRQSIIGILKGSYFGNTEGYSSYMIAFARQIPDGVWLTGFELIGAGNEISLRGRTVEPEMLPNYVTQLKRESVMQGKSFSELQMRRPIFIADGASTSQPIRKVFNNGSKDTKAGVQDVKYLEFELHTLEANEKNASQGGKAQ